MSATEAAFREISAEPRSESLPLSHLSIELGHLYMEDFAAGVDGLRAHFCGVAPWLAAARAACLEAMPPGRAPRISTCFLIDDYFTQLSSPDIVLDQLLTAADESGVGIDYVAREAGCARADGVELARLVEGRLVADPPPGANGNRPSVTEVGWLCNGERTPGTDSAPAMGSGPSWVAPSQNDRTRHSVFMDVELWDDVGDARTWSCAFLAAVWQLLRLGMIRDNGRAVGQPTPWEGSWPRRWEQVPAIVRIDPAAKPFSAYRTMSILAPRFLPIEHAVRTILAQVAVEREIQQEVVERSDRERVELPRELVDRIQYIFTGATSARR